MKNDFRELNELMRICVSLKESLASAADNYLDLLKEEEIAREKADSGELLSSNEGKSDLERLAKAKEENDIRAHKLVVIVFQYNPYLTALYYYNSYECRINPKLKYFDPGDIS